MLLGVAAASSDDAWAVGKELLTSGGQPALIEHWNGQAWAQVPSPHPNRAESSSLYSVTAVSADDVWAVGNSQARDVGLTLAEHWNGRRWSVVPTPGQGGTGTFSYLNGVAAGSAGDVWAVGYRSDTSSIDTLIEHWNGHAWMKVTSPNGGWGGALTAVATVSAHDAWVVGQSLARSLRPTALAERWNGQAWNLS
jgi:hypothetical protein